MELSQDLMEKFSECLIKKRCNGTLSVQEGVYNPKTLPPHMKGFKKSHMTAKIEVRVVDVFGDLMAIGAGQTREEAYKECKACILYCIWHLQTVCKSSHLRRTKRWRWLENERSLVDSTGKITRRLLEVFKK